MIAIIPVLLAAPRRRLTLPCVAGSSPRALTLPMIFAAPDDVRRRARGGGAARRRRSAPPNVWWPISLAAHRTRSAPRSHPASRTRSPPGWPGSPIRSIVLAGLPLGLLFWRRRRALTAEDALGLLALLLLLRCLLDPWNNDYYHAPFLLALLSWEALARSGWPRLTVLAGGRAGAHVPRLGAHLHRAVRAGGSLGAGYLCWAVPLAGWIAMPLFAPRPAMRSSRACGRSARGRRRRAREPLTWLDA